MSGGALRVIFAIEGDEERRAFTSIFSSACPDGELFFPSDITDVEAIYSKDRADAIVTDFRFHGGALADWLTFWPLPVILLVDPDDDMDRVEKTVRDEAALFVQRQPLLGHIRALPLLIRKSLNIRESNARQNAHLLMSEHQYLNLLQAIPDIVYMLDAEGRFAYINDAVRNLGYEPSALIGKHFSRIVHPEDVPRVSRVEALRPLQGVATGDENAPKLFDERRSGKRMTRNLELRLRPGDNSSGDYRLASVTAYGEVNSLGYALPEFEGRGQGTVGIIRDITVRKEHQFALESALESKDLLLKEIHHRVKNNLQVVSSLLNIQEATIRDEEARKVFVECQTQIQTMSMVHEVLYRSSIFEGVEMESYFRRLVDYLSSVYEVSYRGIACEVEAEGVILELDDAIPIALIVNELVSNCMKHAFPEMREGKIRVSLRKGPPSASDDDSGSLLLEVEDDGIGSEGSRGEAAEDRKEAGIGTELVLALASQVRGEVARSRGRSGTGTLVSITFTK